MANFENARLKVQYHVGQNRVVVNNSIIYSHNIGLDISTGKADGDLERAEPSMRAATALMMINEWAKWGGINLHPSFSREPTMHIEGDLTVAQWLAVDGEKEKIRKRIEENSGANKKAECHCCSCKCKDDA